MSVTAGRSARKIREGVWSSVWGSSDGMDMVGERIGRRGGDSSMDVIGRMIAFSCECKHMLNRGLMCREKKILDTLSCGILTEADSMRELSLQLLLSSLPGLILKPGVRSRPVPCVTLGSHPSLSAVAVLTACSRNLS